MLEPVANQPDVVAMFERLKPLLELANRIAATLDVRSVGAEHIQALTPPSTESIIASSGSFP